MNAIPQTYDEQAKLWNGPSGHAWVEGQDILDQMFRPLQDRLLEAVTSASSARVLDVGCGTGSTTLAVARKLGPAGSCTGIDISEPMIGAARTQAARENSTARFIVADAQNYVFEPAGFDLIISRIGVMFFADPVAAFANLLQAARPGATLRFIAWRSAAENPFMTTAEQAAAPFVPNIPVRRPGGTGQFAFADQGRIRGILEASGWDSIEIRPVDLPCAFSEKDLVRYFTRLGPLGLALRDTDEQTRSYVIKRVCAAFEPYVRDAEVRFDAACWVVDAQA